MRLTNRRNAIDAEEPAGSARTDRLLDDLESIMLREGFLHLRTDDLAKRLRCSKRTLYRLAPTREGLFERAVEKWLTRIRNDGHAAVRAAPDIPSAITSYLNVAVQDTRDASPAFVRDLARFPAGTRRLMSHQRKRIAGLERLIDDGVREGAFRGVHPRLVAEVMLVAVGRMVDPDLLAACDLSMSRAFEELYGIFGYGMAATRPSGDRVGRTERRDAPVPSVAASRAGTRSARR